MQVAASAPRSHIAVAIATAGRAEILNHTLDRIAAQTRRPDEIVICPAAPDDVDHAWLAKCAVPTRIVTGPRGLTAQRNETLRALPHADIILFVDDDFLLAPSYIAQMEALFAAHDDLVMLTGWVIADGKKGPGLTPQEGARILDGFMPPPSGEMTDVFNGYGCNMAFRWSQLRDHNLWFDENLPLYSWLEDVDFSRIAAPFGRLAKSRDLIGVHLGTKRGRTPGVKFGYSQIANQVYLVRKGTVQLPQAVRKVCENIVANTIGAIWSEPYIDRRGRLLGNLYAMLDALRARLSPRRILEL